MAQASPKRQNILVGIRPDGSQVSVRRMIRSDPATSAAISKLTQPERRPQYTNKGEMKVETPSVQQLRDRANQIADNQRDAENILATMPDIEMMGQLLISSIMSPHDLITKEVNISSKFELINPTLKASLIAKIKQYFDEDYRIKELIQPILESILLYDGSYASLILPENALDELINGRSNFSSEDLDGTGLFNKADHSLLPLGLLCAPKQERAASQAFSLESFQLDSASAYNVQSAVTIVNSKEEVIDLGVKVVDNFNVLKLPLLLETKRTKLHEQAIAKAAGRANVRNFNQVSTESYADFFKGSDLSDRSIHSLVYKSRHRTNDVVRVVRTQDQLVRRSIGEPLVLKIPSEAFIPVFVPGQEDKQVGAFILLDAVGNFITKESLNNTYGGFQVSDATQRNFASSLLERVKYNYVGNFDCADPKWQQQLLDSYTQVVEADFMARLRNLTYGTTARISSNQEIYRIMLIRHLAGNMTQALWVPKELFTYFAFDFNNAGVGRSILDKIKVIASLRAIVMMANVKASIRNSIGETVIDVELDERDPDPLKTQELIYDLVAKTRQEAMPIGIQNPADITEWLARAGVRMTFSGHPGIPDTKIESRQEGMNYVKPDGELLEDLEKYTAKAFGLSPEQIDNIHQPDHATTIVSNNILFAKRVINYQDKFNPLLSNHCRQMCTYSQTVYENVFNTIATNFKMLELTEELHERAAQNPEVKKTIIDLVSKDFINSLLFELPKPKNIRVENQIAELEALETLTDKILEYYFNEATFSSEAFGELAGSAAQNLKEIVKAYLMRKQIGDSAILSDLAGLFSDKFDESEFKTIFAELDNIVKPSLASYVTHLSNNTVFKKKMQKATEVLDVDPDAVEGSAGGTDQSSSGDNTSDSDFPGLDDFNEFSEDSSAPEDTQSESNNDKDTDSEQAPRDQPDDFSLRF